MILMVEISGKGGICHYTYNLCKELSKIASLVLATSLNYELENLNLEKTKVIKVFNRFKTNPFNIFKLFKFSKKQNIKAVHFQLSQHPEFILFLAFIFKYFLGNKIIITAHNIVDHENRRYFRALFKKIYKIADFIIIHSNNSKLELSESFHLLEDKVKVIPHGNYLFFNNSLLKQRLAKMEGSTQYILFYGFIRKYKGLLNLIKSFDTVRKDLKNTRLIIAGKPVESFDVYRREIIRRNLQDYIDLDLSYVDFKKTAEYFSRADLVALPYERVYQSGVLQIAYAFGKPVVVTNTGGLPEVVQQGESGFIVKPDNENELSEAIKKILTDEGLKKRMGERALNLAKTKYSWENIAHLTKSVYDNLTD